MLKRLQYFVQKIQCLSERVFFMDFLSFLPCFSQLLSTINIIKPHCSSMNSSTGASWTSSEKEDTTPQGCTGLSSTFLVESPAGIPPLFSSSYKVWCLDWKISKQTSRFLIQCTTILNWLLLANIQWYVSGASTYYLSFKTYSMLYIGLLLRRAKRYLSQFLRFQEWESSKCWSDRSSPLQGLISLFSGKERDSTSYCSHPHGISVGKVKK